MHSYPPLPLPVAPRGTAPAEEELVRAGRPGLQSAGGDGVFPGPDGGNAGNVEFHPAVPGRQGTAIAGVSRIQGSDHPRIRCEGRMVAQGIPGPVDQVHQVVIGGVSGFTGRTGQPPQAGFP